MTYTSTANGNTSFNEPPAWRLTTVPEGWKLHDVHIMGQNGNCIWMYRKGKDSLTFTCRYLGSSRVGLSLRSEADASSVYHAATVNGASADFYQDDGQGILIWENMDEMLCQLKGPLSQTELETIASTAAETKANALPVYQLGWVPEGSTNPSRATLREAVQEGWTGPDQVTFHWMYAAASAGALAEPDGTPETVTVNGIQAKYWAGDPDAEGRITISRGPDDDSMQKVLESPAEGQLNTLMWTDTATGITFRIQGEMDKSILIRMAENVAIKK